MTVATISMIFVRIDLPIFVQFNSLNAVQFISVVQIL